MTNLPVPFVTPHRVVRPKDVTSREDPVPKGLETWVIYNLSNGRIRTVTRGSKLTAEVNMKQGEGIAQGDHLTSFGKHGVQDGRIVDLLSHDLRLPIYGKRDEPLTLDLPLGSRVYVNEELTVTADDDPTEIVFESPGRYILRVETDGYQDLRDRILVS